MGERFQRWAARVTREGTFDLSKVIEFVADVKAIGRAEGRKVSNVWWSKIKPVKEGAGLVPQSMKHPRTRQRFVFPMFEVDRTGRLVQAKLVEPRCPKCGEAMQRRLRLDGSGEFFGCTKFPDCRGACDAWSPVAVGVPKRVDEQLLVDDEKEEEEEEKEPEPEQSPEEKLAKRICEVVAKARKMVETHNLSLPIGYRTVNHLTILSQILGDPDQAVRLWADGRLSEQERAKFLEAGLPVQPFSYGESPDEEPSWYHLLSKIVDSGLPVFLVGEAGSGKTRFASWYSRRVGKRLHTAAGSDDVAGRELWVARRDAKKGETMTVEGPAAEASRKGEILFLDEMDGFPSNSLLPLNTILNGDRRIYAPVIGEIEVHSGLRIIGAANTNGRSKDRTYTGRNRLDGAFLNRFAVVVRTEYEERIDRKVVLETLASLKKPEEKKKPKPEEKKKPKPEEKPTKKAKVTVKKTAKKAGR